MSALIDSRDIGPNQRVELYEDGVLWLIDGKKRTAIKLDASATEQFSEFLGLHKDRIGRHAAQQRQGRGRGKEA